MRRGVAGITCACCWRWERRRRHRGRRCRRTVEGRSRTNGVAVVPENTLPAFETAAANGWVVELDVLPHAGRDDRHPRPDAGSHERSAPEARAPYAPPRLRGCPSDVLGSPGSSLGGVLVPGLRVALPTLPEVLALAKRTGAKLSIEIKNVPTESDFDALIPRCLRDGRRDQGLGRPRLAARRAELLAAEPRHRRAASCPRCRPRCSRSARSTTPHRSTPRPAATSGSRRSGRCRRRRSRSPTRSA